MPLAELVFRLESGPVVSPEPVLRRLEGRSVVRDWDDGDRPDREADDGDLSSL